MRAPSISLGHPIFRSAIIKNSAGRGMSTVQGVKASHPRASRWREMMFGRRIAILLALLLLGAADALAQAKPDSPEFDVKEHYTKYEYRIPMRDGVFLFTAVYVPKDSSQSYPFLINRTPYSVAPYGVDQYRSRLGPSSDFDKAGYIFVMQDVRGRYMSEGKFVEMRPHIDNKKSNQDVDDSSDLYDTIEWLLKNVPNNN